jgi:hypothetical protein
LSQGYRSAGYDFVRVEVDAAGVISYTVDSSRARHEVRAQVAQLPLLRNLIENAASGRPDVQIGRTLFQLLVPVELEPFFAQSPEVVIELDPGTAAIPWELLDTNDGERAESMPWAIRSKLLRQFRSRFIATADSRNDEPSILIVGEPFVDSSYPRLPGARAEAAAVATCFNASERTRTATMSLVSPELEPGPDAHAVINGLLSRDWRIVHLTGHGALPRYDATGAQSSRSAGGLVLSNGAVLGPREIASMRRIPELLFVNCCHQPMASETTNLLEQPGSANWPLFASQLSEALLTSGVRCVVLAGWAVDDDAASAFASRFYGELLLGRRFIDAVTAARLDAFQVGGNTWAAYQCYGDPDWGLLHGMSATRRPLPPISAQFDGVVSEQQLKIALGTIVVRCELDFEGPTERAKIEYLETRFSDRWGHDGAVAEAFGDAWAAAGDLAQAVRWFGRALSCGDGRASLRAAERFADLRVRLAMAQVRNAGTPPASARRQQAKSAESLMSARSEVAEGIRFLEHVNAVASTTPRTTVLASAYKQLAMIEYVAERKTEENHALTMMQEYYTQAASQAREGRDHALSSIAAALNGFAATLLHWESGAELRLIDSESVARVRKGLKQLNATSPDFWSVIAEIELRLYEALSEQALSMNLGVIEERLNDLFVRVSTPGFWESVLNQHELLLRKYADRAPAGERVAALTLIEALGRFAAVRKEVRRSDVVIAHGAIDRDVAERIAKGLEAAGLSAAMSTGTEDFEIVARREEALEKSKASVVLLSRATNTPDQALVSYWGSILRRRWRDPRYPIVLVTRHRDAMPPGFLPDGPLRALGETSAGFAKLTAEIVKAVRAGSRPPLKRKTRTARSKRK